MAKHDLINVTHLTVTTYRFLALCLAVCGTFLRSFLYLLFRPNSDLTTGRECELCVAYIETF